MLDFTLTCSFEGGKPNLLMQHLETDTRFTPRFQDIYLQIIISFSTTNTFCKVWQVQNHDDDNNGKDHTQTDQAYCLRAWRLLYV